MSSSMWGYLFLILGIMAAALLLLFGNINTKNEENYYLLKEVMQNAMLDSVDKETYQNGITQERISKINEESAREEVFSCPANLPGTIRIVTEKFVENFSRRYSEVVNTSKKYKIEIFDIQECPPKVSLRVTTTENYSWVERLFTGSSEGDEETVIVNELSAILETVE